MTARALLWWLLAAASASSPAPAGDARVSFTATARGFQFAANGTSPGARYFVYDGPAARRALAGSWLSFSGDSSLRGLFLALLQLVGDRRRATASAADGAVEFRVGEWLGERNPDGPSKRPRLNRHELRGDALKFGWIDVIVNASDGAFAAVHAAGHDMHFGADARPVVDASDALAAFWAPPAGHDRLRLTFRMLTSAHELARLRDPFRRGRATGPDAEVVEVGAWDHARRAVAPAAFAVPLRAFLDDWVAPRARAAPRRVFATMPRRFEALDPRGDGTYERTLAARLAPAPLFLNRVAARDDLARGLGAACPCCAAESYHPPHIHNLWDAQRLLNLLRPHAKAAPEGDVDLAPPGFAACCCAPPNATKTAGQIAHWARLCVPADGAPD